MKKILIIVLSLIFVVSASLVIRELYLYNLDKELYKDIQENKPKVSYIKEEDTVPKQEEETDEVESDETIKLTEEEKELLRINSDYKFWITINETNVDYPVVQTDNNDYYLDHNFTGEDSKAGTIFVDYRNDISEDKNIVIYGHFMKNRTMFSDIAQYKKEDFFNDKSKYISIMVGNKEYKYEVFSAYPIRANEIVIPLDFENDIEYLRYLEGLVDLSLQKKDVNFDTDKKMITLVTCSYEWDDTRTLVHAIPLD